MEGLNLYKILYEPPSPTSQRDDQAGIFDGPTLITPTTLTTLTMTQNWDVKTVLHSHNIFHFLFAPFSKLLFVRAGK